jgi:hypothetical protein
MALEEANEPTTRQQSRCKFGKTFFAEGECQRLGEVKLDGRLLCVACATLLRLKVRESTLLGTMLEMDKWLDNPSNMADELVWQRAQHERDETGEDLRFAYMLIEAHKEADQQR